MPARRTDNAKLALVTAQPTSSSPYQPTTVERAALDAYDARRAALPPAVRIKIVPEKNGAVRFDYDHEDRETGRDLVGHALGDTSPLFVQTLLGQVMNAVTIGKKPDENQLNFVLAMMRDMAPRDALEAVLTAQMVTVHTQIMVMARRLANCETIAQQDSAERALNKLARTFTAQVEALKRYRSKGEQVVRVERVYVAEGGQAIVGNVNHPGGGPSKKIEDQSHEPKALRVHQGTALSSSFEAHAEAVPQSRSER